VKKDTFPSEDMAENFMKHVDMIDVGVDKYMQTHEHILF